jgi:hypothetical protein
MWLAPGNLSLDRLARLKKGNPLTLCFCPYQEEKTCHEKAAVDSHSSLSAWKRGGVSIEGCVWGTVDGPTHDDPPINSDEISQSPRSVSATGS